MKYKLSRLFGVQSPRCNSDLSPEDKDEGHAPFFCVLAGIGRYSIYSKGPCIHIAYAVPVLGTMFLVITDAFNK